MRQNGICISVQATYILSAAYSHAFRSILYDFPAAVSARGRSHSENPIEPCWGEGRDGAGEKAETRMLIAERVEPGPEFDPPTHYNKYSDSKL